MFIFLFVLYIAASVASQFLTGTPIELGTFGGVPIWMPLSAFTLVPLVDVLRSFTQESAEKKGLSFRFTFWLMFIVSTVVAGICVLFADLPLPIFTGVLLAITVGGTLDILVFRKMGDYFTNTVHRMMFSNALATLVGSGIVFAVAFTDLVFANSWLAMPYHEAAIGWLVQSVTVWCCGIGIAAVLNKLKR